MSQNHKGVPRSARHALIGATAIALLAASGAASAVTYFGSLSNFDAVNGTGETTYGFEVELDGVSAAPYTFTMSRFGAPTIIPFAGGIYVRWQANWNAATQQWEQAYAGVPQLVGAGAGVVPNQVVSPTAGHQCVYWLPNYATSGCDHFGVALPYYVNPTATAMRWLVQDPNTPGGLLYAGTNVTPAVPTPAAPIPPAPPPAVPAVPIPPAVVQVQAAQPDVVQVQVEAPPPPRPELQFGDAEWVKVFKRQLPREVALEELQGDNVAVVPEDNAEVETSWKLLQRNPHNPNSGSSVLRNSDRPGAGTRSIVRRYEFYKFTGQYDPVDHGAICADGLCNTPAPEELGELIAANMQAANIGNPAVTVTKVGNGTVAGGVPGTANKISCGNTCTAPFSLNDSVTLTATAGSGSLFGGWTGACSGLQNTCSLNVSDEMNVTARFLRLFTLSIGGTGGNGSVVGTPNGELGTKINCGSNGCSSAKFTDGTSVTLTATPAPGRQFLGWGGACAGAAPVCSVKLIKDTSVTASFK